METSTLKPFGQDTAKLTDKVADTASGAIRSTQDVTNAAFDRLAVKVDTAREQVAPVADRLSMQAQEAARRGVGAVREASTQLRETAVKASDTTIAYIKDEPVKAMLISAAVGAASMALINLNRSRGAR